MPLILLQKPPQLLRSPGSWVPRKILSPNSVGTTSRLTLFKRARNSPNCRFVCRTGDSLLQMTQVAVQSQRLMHCVETLLYMYCGRHTHTHQETCALCFRFESPRAHYEGMDMEPKMPTPAKIRWINAFNKVCTQLNEVRAASIIAHVARGGCAGVKLNPAFTFHEKQFLQFENRKRDSVNGFGFLQQTFHSCVLCCFAHQQSPACSSLMSCGQTNPDVFKPCVTADVPWMSIWNVNPATPHENEIGVFDNTSFSSVR